MKNRTDWEKYIQNNGILGMNNCPFCKKDEDNLVIYKTKFWEIRFNKYPYGGIKNHLLVIPKRHIELTKDLKKEEFAELKEINIFLNKFYQGEKYFCFNRESFNGRSIKHLHFHYLPGNIYSNDFEKILHKNNK